MAKEIFKLHLIGKSTITKGGSMHVPSRVMTNAKIKESDVLEWYPPDVDVPDEFVKDCLIVRIIRSS